MDPNPMNSRRLQGASAEPVAAHGGGATPPVEAGSPTTLGASDEASSADAFIAVRLVESEAHTPCRFWVGLTQPGPLAVPQLFDSQDVGALLEAAAMQGTSEKAPLMLSDTELSPPRFIYLLPLPKAGERASWIEAMVGALASWSPEHVGFYVAPDVLASGDGDDLLQAMLAATLRRGVCREVHLLVGRHGLNALVNTALRLKADLEQERLDVVVFH